MKYTLFSYPIHAQVHQQPPSQTTMSQMGVWVKRLTILGCITTHICSLGRKNGVIFSPSASYGTHFLAPSFSSKGGKFNILDRVEEEESDLKPQDLEVWDMILEKRKKNFKGFQVFEEKEEKFQRARKWKDWNGHCVSNHSQVVYGPHKLTYTG